MTSNTETKTETKALSYRTERVAAGELDPTRLEWRRGYPSHDGVTFGAWSYWINDLRVARLETAIVEDTISPYLDGGYQHITAKYERASYPEGYQGPVCHYPRVAWRIVRESDGAVLYTSLDANPSQRVVPAGVPVNWGHQIREAILRGDLPPPLISRKRPLTGRRVCTMSIDMTTMTTPITQTNHYNVEITTFTADHGIADAKGRAIGGVAMVAKHGDTYHLHVRAARNGQPYGASTGSGGQFSTLDAALDAAHAALLAQGERYRKAACKAAAAV